MPTDVRSYTAKRCSRVEVKAKLSLGNTIKRGTSSALSPTGG